LKVFEENESLFLQLKYHLCRKIQRSKYHRYAPLFEAINQNNFQWQIDVSWNIFRDSQFQERLDSLMKK